MTASRPWAGRWWRLVASLVLLAVAAGIGGGWIRDAALVQIRVVNAYDEDFDRGVLHRPSAVSMEGFEPCESGLCLAGGDAGVLTYRVPGRGPVNIRLWVHLPPGGSNRVDYSLDGGVTFEEWGRDVQWSGQPLSAPAAESLVLAVDAANPHRGQALVVDKLALRYCEGPCGPALPARWQVVMAFLLFGLALVPLLRRPWPAVATLAVVALALAVRYEAVTDARWNTLEPDADAYRVYAQAMDPLSSDRGFYSARFGEREPLFVLLTHLVFRVAGSSDWQLRLVSVAASVLLVWCVIRFVRAVAGEPWGLASGVLIASNQPLLHEATRGLRLEVETVLWLCALAVLFVWRRAMDWPRVVAVGTVGGLLALTRSTYVPVMLLLVPLALWQCRHATPRWWLKAGAAMMLVVALVVPHRYGMYKHRGDPFWDTAVYARWLANFEFVGQPGFPTAEELRVNGYAGPPITYREYLFGMHSTGELVTGTIRGYAALFRNMQQCVPAARRGGCAWANVALQASAAAGMILIVVSRRRLVWVPLAFLVVEYPVAFLYDRGLLEPYRHSFQGFPLLLVAAAVLAGSLARQLRSGARRVAVETT